MKSEVKGCFPGEGHPRRLLGCGRAGWVGPLGRMAWLCGTVADPTFHFRCYCPTTVHSTIPFAFSFFVSPLCRTAEWNRNMSVVEYPSGDDCGKNAALIRKYRNLTATDSYIRFSTSFRLRSSRVSRSGISNRLPSTSIRRRRRAPGHCAFSETF